ncbi:MAG: exo-alpha-sialidase [Bacteroidota bacterium]
MMRIKNLTYVVSFAGIFMQAAKAQDTVRYVGKTLVNVDYHSGQLSPTMGVHNIQVVRANRADTSATSGFGWTYNHAPMIAYWNKTFYLQYLSNPVGEHEGQGQTLLLTSPDGYNWSKPSIVFPPYKIKDGTVKTGKTDTAKNMYAVMHQRVGFFTSSNKKLLTLGYYGMVLAPKDDPNDGNGIGRVVREINSNGSLGAIYFLRFNHAFNEKNTSYPFYKKAKDKAFIAACEELLASPLQMQQMVEESDKDDPLIPLKKDFKAFSYYYISGGRTVGLWKYALTSVSNNGGKSWLYNPTRAPGFVNANAKIWGQKTSDGKYATVYNPSEFRWPLALSVSDDGLTYKNLLLVNGEISSMRYGGAYKSYGPQYVRGIQDINGTPPGGNVWLTYSMNKEDIWVSNVPVPVVEQAAAHVNDDFSLMPDKKELDSWNIYSPAWSRAQIERGANGKKMLALHDQDPFDYAKAERMFPASQKLTAEFTVVPQQADRGLLEIELLDKKGMPCVRISFDSTGTIITKAGYRNKSLAPYQAGVPYHFIVELNTANRFYTVTINGKNTGNNLCFAPVEAVERISFRTGSIRRFPDADTPTDQDYDLPGAGDSSRESVYQLLSLKTAGSKL